MTIWVADGKRLTWDAAFPAPFESGWAIFAKVAILNNMNLSELTTLIRCDAAVDGTARAVDCSDSSWIDFERFAGLLGVDERRLKTGFWDQFGITPIFKNRYEIRRCPKCWELGYHCALFDLAALSSCPWHRCKLTDSCASCAFPSTFSLRTAHGIINSRFCSRCGTILPVFSHLLLMDRIDANHAAMIVGYCREFIDWWGLVGRKIPERDIMLTEILRIGDDPPQNPSYRSWQIGRALAVTGENALAWKFYPLPIDVKHSSWIDSFEQSTMVGRGPTDHRFRIRGDAGKFYRSLRKHLYKKFVRPHKNCCRFLSNLQRDESHALDGDEICVVSLAFLVWRMSIEGLCNVEGLRFHRRDNFSLRLMGPDERYDISVGTRLLWSYFGFLAIWRELDSLCGSENLRVQIFGSRCDGHFQWRYISPHQKDEIFNLSHPCRFYVLYPNPSPLVESAMAVCADRRKRRGDMRDMNQLARDYEWLWAKNNSSLHNCLFQLRHSKSIKHNHFLYLTV